MEVNLPSIVGGAFFPGTNDDDDDGCGGRGNASSSTTATTTTRHAWVGREWIQQSIRPTVCVLCSHDSGVHAMHPLLDVHGPEGRQLTWSGRHSNKNTTTSKEGTKQLAWVHTLCASMICSNANTMGCVYGCDTNGNFYYDDDDDDVASGKSENEDEDDDEEEWKDDSFEFNHQSSSTGDGMKMDCSRSTSAHRVSITSTNNNSNISTAYYAIASTGIYARTIADHRKLKCFICGRIDNQWRIPLQCAAGDDTEYGPFQERHPHGIGIEQCTVAVHVGCARWGCTEPEGSHLETIDGKRCNLCFFTPGRDDVNDDTNDNDEHPHVDHDDVHTIHKDRRKESDETGNFTAMAPTADANTCETVAHCYCTAHARDIVMNHPRNITASTTTRKRKKSDITTDMTSTHSVIVERMPVFPRDRIDRGLARREMKFIANNSSGLHTNITSDSRRQLIRRVSKKF